MTWQRTCGRRGGVFSTTAASPYGRSPGCMRRSAASKLSAHAQFKIETGIPVFFADPQSHGNVVPMRTPMVCCANTFRRAQTPADEGHRGCDPVVAGALQRLIDGGAKRTYWHVKALYQAEDIAKDRTPSQGGKLVWFYDEMFNGGQPFLTEIWEQVRIADPPRSRPSRPPQRGPVPGDDVQWLADLTVPDDVQVPPNLEFTKSWRLYNAGTVPWVGRRVVRVGPSTSYGLVRSPPWRSCPPSAARPDKRDAAPYQP